MKNRKVLNLRTHVGGLHGKTSFDAVKDGLLMEITAAGVEIKNEDGSPFVRKGTNGGSDIKYFLVEPWPNCTELMVFAEEQAEEEKRGPGRPPGPKVVA